MPITSDFFLFIIYDNVRTRVTSSGFEHFQCKYNKPCKALGDDFVIANDKIKKCECVRGMFF